METKHFQQIKMAYFISLDNRTVEELKTRWKNMNKSDPTKKKDIPYYKRRGYFDEAEQACKIVIEMYDMDNDHSYMAIRDMFNHHFPGGALREKTIEEIKQGCQKAMKEKEALLAKQKKEALARQKKRKANEEYLHREQASLTKKTLKNVLKDFL
jgi:hypothetical protein